MSCISADKHGGLAVILPWQRYLIIDIQDSEKIVIKLLHTTFGIIHCRIILICSSAVVGDYHASMISAEKWYCIFLVVETLEHVDW